MCITKTSLLRSVTSLHSSNGFPWLASFSSALFSSSFDISFGDSIARRKPEHFLNALTQLCPNVKTPKNVCWHPSHHQYPSFASTTRDSFDDIGARASLRRLLYFFCGFSKYAKIEREKNEREGAHILHFAADATFSFRAKVLQRSAFYEHIYYIYLTAKRINMTTHFTRGWFLREFSRRIRLVPSSFPTRPTRRRE